MSGDNKAVAARSPESLIPVVRLREWASAEQHDRSSQLAVLFDSPLSAYLRKRPGAINGQLSHH